MSKAFILKSRPTGIPALNNFEETEIVLPVLDKDQVLIRGKFYSVDPYMRGRMSDQKSYVPPFEVSQPITGGVVGEVTESNSPDFKAGDYVLGMLKWQDIQIACAKDLRKIDVNQVPASYYLGLLGMTGLTAYLGLEKIGKPKIGETVVVSGAAGAVGMVVGQIAKIQGCKVIGIAGSKEKISFLENQLGFDAAIDYHDIHKMEEELSKAAPSGVDIYFDNVGGPVSDAVLKLINHGARIIVCGQISMYNDVNPPVGPYPQIQLIKNSALMQGFIVNDFQDSFPEAMHQLIKWYKEGLLKGEETIVKGFDKLPETFIGLFEGKNLGKMIVEA